MVYNHTYLDPARVTAPDDTLIDKSIEMGVQGIVVYAGFLERRYRYHYEVLIESYVYKENITDFTSAIQNEWSTNKKGKV